MVTIFYCIAQFAFAQNTDRTQDPNRISQQGKLMTIQLIPGEPIKIFVVGKEEAQIDLSKLKLTVHRLSPGHQRALKLTREGDSFILNEKVTSPATLDITAQAGSESESFQIKIPAKP